MDRAAFSDARGETSVRAGLVAGISLVDVAGVDAFTAGRGGREGKPKMIGNVSGGSGLSSIAGALPGKTIAATVGRNCGGMNAGWRPEIASGRSSITIRFGASRRLTSKLAGLSRSKTTRVVPGVVSATRTRFTRRSLT